MVFPGVLRQCCFLIAVQRRYISTEGSDQALTLQTAQCGNPSLTAHCIALQITELIHVASLLHDDVVDSAHMRRGLKALNVTFGNKVRKTI
jgi:geranylgeranyl pyrophosphate synthase